MVSVTEKESSNLKLVICMRASFNKDSSMAMGYYTMPTTMYTRATGSKANVMVKEHTRGLVVATAGVVFGSMIA
jgi:hypothetical protein